MKKIILLLASTMLLAGCVENNPTPPSPSSVPEKTLKEKAFDAIMSATETHKTRNSDMNVQNKFESFGSTQVFNAENSPIEHKDNNASFYGTTAFSTYDSTKNAYAFQEYEIIDLANNVLEDDPTTSYYIEKVGASYYEYAFTYYSEDKAEAHQVDEAFALYNIKYDFESYFISLASEFTDVSSLDEILHAYYFYLYDSGDYTIDDTKLTLDIKEDKNVYSIEAKFEVSFESEGVEKYLLITESTSFDENAIYANSFSVCETYNTPLENGNYSLDTYEETTSRTFEYKTNDLLKMLATERAMIEAKYPDYSTITKRTQSVRIIVDDIYYCDEFEYGLTIEEVAIAIGVDLSHSSLGKAYLDEDKTNEIALDSAIPCSYYCIYYIDSIPDAGYAVISIDYTIVADDTYYGVGDERITVSIDTPYVISLTITSTMPKITGLAYTSILLDGTPINETNNSVTLENKVYHLDYNYEGPANS